MPTTYPANYELLNNSDVKSLNVVVVFEGNATKFSLLPTYKKLRWGDPGIDFGDPGITYGGLIPLAGNKAILSPNTQLVISQKVEPEQGRASVSTMSLEFIDYQGFMTEFVSPGKTLDEILGGKQVKVYIGYQNSSFKEDYFVIFRGYVSNITSAATKMILQLSDANLKRRQQTFLFGQTKLANFSYNFTSSDVSVLNDTINISGGQVLQNGNRIQLSTTGVLPTPFVTATDYFVTSSTGTTFKLSATSGGAVIDITNAGSGGSTVTLTGTGLLATKVYVNSNDDFVRQILGPNGLYDPGVVTYIKVDNEIMSYSNSGIFSNYFVVARAQRGTPDEDHDVADNTVNNLVELQDNIINLSLKMMLSGWDGVWTSNQPIQAFVTTGDIDFPTVPKGMVLPDGVDAVEDYGLSPGDYIYITGSASNNGTYIVTGFLDKSKFPNNIILLNSNLVNEPSTSAVFSTRSQYDTFPTSCGSQLKPTDVDVAQFVYIKNTFLFHTYDKMRVFVTQPQSAKDYIETQFLLPAGAYSITRFGRISCTITKPPLAGENLVILDETNVLTPQNVIVARGLNNRRFFNNIQFRYDYGDDGKNNSTLTRIDTDSLTLFNTNSVLPINAEGLRTDLGAVNFINQHVTFLISRYKNVATEYTLQCNWKAASLVETGDIIALYDNGHLQIANFDTGERNLGSQLFEVINRAIDIRTGVGTLHLLQTSGYLVTDRFAGIAPSSLIATGSTTSIVVIQDSFGALYPLNEKKKYEPIIGDLIAVHSPDFSFYEEVTLLGFVPGSPYHALVDPPLSSPPPAGYIFECAKYPNDSNKSLQAKTKLLFSSIDPSVIIVSGTSNTAFVVSSMDSSKFTAGLQVSVHNKDYSIDSPEVFVDSIVGNTINLKTSLGFTPAPGQLAELIGFIDGLGPYRIL